MPIPSDFVPDRDSINFKKVASELEALKNKLREWEDYYKKVICTGQGVYCCLKCNWIKKRDASGSFSCPKCGGYVAISVLHSYYGPGYEEGDFPEASQRLPARPLK